MKIPQFLIGTFLLVLASSTALADTLRPDPVTGVKASAISSTSVRVTWNKPWDNVGVTGYNVFRDWKYLTTVHNTNFIDQNASAGSKHHYAITAFDAANNFSCITPYTAVQTPATGVSVPTGLKYSAVNSNQVRISWNAVSGANGYNVFRNGQFVKSVGSAQHDSAWLKAGQDFNYQVAAYAGSQISEWSSPLTVRVSGNTSNTGSTSASNTTPSADGSPVGLRVAILNPNKARVYWNAVNGARGYNFFQDGQFIGSTTATQHDSVWMNPGQLYRFNVQAYYSWGVSPNSKNLMVNTQLPGGIMPDLPAPHLSANGTAPAGWRMVFSEEFNGSNVDWSKWSSAFLWGPNQTTNGEQQYYVDTQNQPGFGYNPFQFDGQHLNITAIRTPDHLKGKANWKPYLSGALNTRGKFKTKYGYFEMRAKMPAGKGVWPAFWLLNESQWGVKPEIDVMEYLGDHPTRWFSSYHYHHDGWNLKSFKSDEIHGPNLSEGYHLFAVKWQPGSIIWYVDGVERFRHESWNVAWEELYIVVNLAIGGWWPGNPDGNTPFPARMSIDWVRAWQP